MRVGFKVGSLVSQAAARRAVALCPVLVVLAGEVVVEEESMNTRESREPRELSSLRTWLCRCAPSQFHHHHHHRAVCFELYVE